MLIKWRPWAVQPFSSYNLFIATLKAVTWITADQALSFNFRSETRLSTLTLVFHPWCQNACRCKRTNGCIKGILLNDIHVVKISGRHNPYFRWIENLSFYFSKSIVFVGRQGGKIKRDIMIADYDQGGPKVVDVPLFAKSLKSTWIKKYLDQNNWVKWKLFLTCICKSLVAQLFLKVIWIN